MGKITLSMIIWGTVGLFVLWSGFPMITIACSRCVIGGLILAGFCYHQGLFKAQFFAKQEVLLAIISGIFLVLNWVLLFESFKLASITVGNVSYYLQPIFLVILGIFFFKERVSLPKGALILLSFVGVVLTTGLSVSDRGSSAHNLLIGVGYATLAGLLYAFVTIITKPIKILPSPVLTLIQLLSGGIILLPFMNYDSLSFHSLAMLPLIYLLIISLVHTAAAYILYYDGIKKVSVTNIAALSYIDPIIAIATDVLFFHRHLNGLQILGIILTLGSSYLVIRLTAKNAEAVVHT